MKYLIYIFLFSTISHFGAIQKVNFETDSLKLNHKSTSYQEGEFLKFRIHYGFLNAGYATLKLTNSVIGGQQLYHAVGKGWTVGVSSLFYNIEDYYDSHFTMGKQVKPIKFIRRVDEGGYIIKRDMFFDHKKKKVTIDDLTKQHKKVMDIHDVQDLVSSFYHLRNYDLSKIKEGDELLVNLFFDEEEYPFKLQFLKKEIIESDFGKIQTWKIRPLVQKGRVFEGQESLTLWISDDANKLPIRIKASLVVGSIKADLTEYDGLIQRLAIVKE
jgi:hypothetical protein